MLTKNEVDRISKLYLEVLNSHDLNRFNEILDENYVNHTRMGTIPGLENFKQLLAGFYNAFPDIQWYEGKTWVDGDHIIYLYYWTGTHLGELNGIPPSGKKVRVEGMEVNEVKNGKLVETSNFADIISLLQQIGAFPGQ